ncbi:MAG: hypothetical protein JW712_09380 [Dehalococcoidales bacterium]|nr:hypothetical protein [Dehalococcoidales bacterium]
MDDVEVFKRFEVASEDCALGKDEYTHPLTVVGKDFCSGETVFAGCYGKVWRIYKNPSNNSLMVLIANYSGETTQEVL